MKHTSGFDPRSVRAVRLARGGPEEENFVRHAYRPFDDRWLYWEADGGLLRRPVGDYRPHVFDDNLWLCNAQHLRKAAHEPQAYFTRHIGARHLIERGASWFPALLRNEGLEHRTGTGHRPNLSTAAKRYLSQLGLGVEDLFHHIQATLHDPAYREANAGALRMEWPRIPLPGWPDGNDDGAAEALSRSAALGRMIAALIDSENPVPGVTQPPLRAELAVIAIPSTTGDATWWGKISPSPPDGVTRAGATR